MNRHQPESTVMYEPYLPSASYDYHFQQPHDVRLDVPHVAYHLTPLSNLAAILDGGLEPRIGPMSSMVGEFEPCICLFVDLMHLSYSQRYLGLRPGDAPIVNDDDPLVLLSVDVPLGQRLSRGAHFEIRTDEPIPATAIDVLDLNYLISNIVEFQIDYTNATPVSPSDINDAISSTSVLPKM